MRVFIIIFFGLGMLNSLIKAIQLMFTEYPRIEKFSLGEDCARLVEGVVLCGWAAYLLWG